ncbi:hypothetical protein [Streptomyces lydicus]|uniref:hypothetical protein n=1 Tax=Streptomyces lydicus TaxID=47763 RepID=UPI0036E24BE0
MTGREYTFTDVHGVRRTIEITPCSCKGDGCENCAAPADYVPDGYVPAWNYSD